MSNLDTSKPVLTEREASYHEARAGIAAREAAASSGGDPAALRSLVSAAALDAVVTASRCGQRTLCGCPLRADDLLVTLCLGLYAQVFGADPRTQLAKGEGAARLEAIAVLAFIFAQAEQAWDLLDRAADATSTADVRAGWARDFRREALAFAGGFGEPEITALGEHLVELARGTSQTEDEPGNAPRPAAS